MAHENVQKFFKTYPKIARKLKNIDKIRSKAKREKAHEALQLLIKTMNQLVRVIPR